MRTPAPTIASNRPEGVDPRTDACGQQRRVRELSSGERAALGITSNLDDLEALLDDAHYLAAREDATYWNEEGQEIDPDDCVGVAGSPALEPVDRDHSHTGPFSLRTRHARQ
ncbi:hypothetical protein [Kineococcus rhizosphaerae]|uniref:Uncharacterized protein n=1 Tax=Kineococcus rhizosphaerae TaxID=559628 RepID=A0A2T0QWS8_9ACTN|nr:hypothetical protein [Kineococcus rhizosphaerae]PRY09929.1 hypothetical protein CLV37_11937 [Kineococcus rhizosphaerae]